MMDLMYFGYDSQKLENEFKESIKVKFSDAQLIDAYDECKGYRQEVHLPEETKDDYLAWIIGDGWLKLSFDMQIMMMDKEQRSEFDRIWLLAKTQYPQSFKS